MLRHPCKQSIIYFLHFYNNFDSDTTYVKQTIDQHETMAKVSAKNEEHTNHHSEQSSVENVFTKHISEGMVTTENSTKSSYNVEELEKVLDSNSIENSEMKDGRKILSEEASNMKEATGMELQKPEIESNVDNSATFSFIFTQFNISSEKQIY